MKTENITYDVLPQAVAFIIKKLNDIETFICAKKDKPEVGHINMPGKRIATAKQLAKYLNRPISAIYQMEHKGQIKASRMPGSRVLYYDLDTIDSMIAIGNNSIPNNKN